MFFMSLITCSHTARCHSLLPLGPPAGGAVHPSVSSVSVRAHWRRCGTYVFCTSSHFHCLMCREAGTLTHNMHCLLLNYSPGQFGKVYKANLKVGTEVKVAIKTIRRYTSEKETQDFMREMSTMANMMHPNIIRLYGLVSEGQSLSSCK